jgi:hypothetical protein
MANKMNLSITFGYSGFILFILFFLIKITEPFSFWNGHFPRFLQSTLSWWDGWFMVFLPLWLPIAVIALIFIIFLIIAYFIMR